MTWGGHDVLYFGLYNTIHFIIAIFAFWKAPHLTYDDQRSRSISFMQDMTTWQANHVEKDLPYLYLGMHITHQDEVITIQSQGKAISLAFQYKDPLGKKTDFRQLSGKCLV